jgi:hypothetical protein
VRWEAETPDDAVAEACNCSMCERMGFLHIMVPKPKFRLLAGKDRLTEYRFNTGVARHLFCAVCGVKSFYVPRSHPDGYSLNVRCMEAAQFRSLEVRPFDGQNWEASAPALAPLSKD